MHWDGAVNLGHIFTLITVLLGVGGVYVALVRRVDRLEDRVNLIWDFVKRRILRLNGDTNGDAGTPKHPF